MLNFTTNYLFFLQLFQLAEELKDHECTERKSKTAYLHCPKCLKVLSNSWSLQRHMKIHKDSNGVRKLEQALVSQRKKKLFCPQVKNRLRYKNVY